MSDLLQQVIVGLAAVAAAAVVLRRLIRAFRTPRVQSACENCSIGAVEVEPRQSR